MLAVVILSVQLGHADRAFFAVDCELLGVATPFMLICHTLGGILAEVAQESVSRTTAERIAEVLNNQDPFVSVQREIVPYTWQYRSESMAKTCGMLKILGRSWYF